MKPNKTKPVLENENTEFKPAKLRQKLTLCHILFMLMGS